MDFVYPRCYHKRSIIYSIKKSKNRKKRYESVKRYPLMDNHRDDAPNLIRTPQKRRRFLIRIVYNELFNKYT